MYFEYMYITYLRVVPPTTAQLPQRLPESWRGERLAAAAKPRLKQNVDELITEHGAKAGDIRRRGERDIDNF